VHRESIRRRAGDHDPGALGVDHPAHELLPARDELDLVEEEVNRLPSPRLGVPAVVLLEKERELPGVDSGEPVVIEAHEDRLLG
jgi:hypothetical protein